MESEWVRWARDWVEVDSNFLGDSYTMISVKRVFLDSTLLTFKLFFKIECKIKRLIT